MVAEVLSLADAMPPRNRSMVITQARLGVRIGELVSLRVQDVAFLRRTVRIERQVATPLGLINALAPRRRNLLKHWAVITW